ncbi:UspA [Caenispirillum salinarum AK4]|uniref:UspA n=1 Tax=Caenispirillum salinarum AK4 TaxID=1238182 RepID=K9GR18_9PROT|nr:universal stress protein [Caenispirillum salinarum]EKV27582.1 UspA [Caenispirillum salinarum AK4]
MPGIKTILAVVGDAQAGRVPMETAFVVARGLSAHVQVMHVRPDPAQSVPLVGEAMSGAMVDEMMQVAEREGKNRAQATRAMFDEYCGRYAVPVNVEPPGLPEMSAEYREETGAEDEVVATAGRVADLIVVGRGGEESEPSAMVTLHTALMESGRCVLLAPSETPSGIGGHIAIAWNGSAEAARAVAGAMSLLTRAKTVTLLVVERGGEGAGPQDLVSHLAWHEVPVHVRHLHGEGASVGSMLLKTSEEVGADLLVMGAYTHSRLRQLFIGGVTRHVLEHAKLPVLLSH